MSHSQDPRDLLEARYKAFIEGNIDFICETHHPDTRGNLDRAALEAWSKNSEWLGMKIDREEERDGKVFLDFTVRYRQGVETFTQREWAEFRKLEDAWYYFDSEFPKPETLRKTNVVGRNDPCPCGSGKKFKKCCALSQL